LLTTERRVQWKPRPVARSRSMLSCFVSRREPYAAEK
jgi:hypothetical protein